LKKIRDTVTALWQGFLFLLSIRKKGSLFPSKDYLLWRLGTVYQSFEKDGTYRPLKDLIRDAWRDRDRVKNFLVWRKQMTARKA
jgi:hypothetical protein